MSKELEKYRKLKISREEEAKLPSFSSHDEARTYFKEIYKDRFQMIGSDIIEEKKIYFYRLVLDQLAYENGLKEMEEHGYMGGSAFLLSTQEIQIFEDGEIHIVH